MRHCGTQIIHTKRLVLRRYTAADARAAFATIYSSTQVFEHMRMDAMPSLEHMRERVAAWVEGYNCLEQYLWVVTLADNGELIGAIGVFENDDTKQWDIGYCYGVRHWGQGYATEVMFAVCEYMFEKAQMSELYCSHATNNPQSARVIEKVGFSCVGEGTFERLDGTIVPSKAYILNKEDF